MRKLTLVALLCGFFLIPRFADAQEFDAAIGFGTLTAPSGSVALANGENVTERGGLYPGFSADFIIKHRLGVSGNVAWRASRNLYAGVLPYRPIFYDFNGIYAPKLGTRATAEMMAGIGAESLRFYTPQFQCSAFSCTNYVSSNHFMGHVGGGLRFYVWGHMFVRPEAHLYLIHNNSEFPSSQATRFGLSIGYTFAPGF